MKHRRAAFARLGTRSCLVLLIASAHPSSVSAQSSSTVPQDVVRQPEPSRLGVGVEVFFTDESFSRDMQIYAVSLEVERPLGAGFWARGAFGVAITTGIRGISRNRADGSSPPQFGVLDTAGNDVIRSGREADTSGLASTGFLRWRSARLGPLAPFLEGGGGLLWTREPFPPDGTPWNLTYRYGVGLDFAVTRDVGFSIAFRHIHVSNAKGKVPENPAYNGNGFVVSLGW